MIMNKIGINNLIELLANNSTLQELIDYSSILLGNPMLLLDSTMNILAVHDDENINDSIWRRYLSGTLNSIDQEDESELINLMQKVMFNSQPIISEVKVDNYRRIVSKISSSGKILGYLMCLEYSNRFDEETMNSMQIICNLFSIELQRKNSVFILEDSAHTKVLKSILLKNVIYSDKFLKTIFGSSEKNYYMISIQLKDFALTDTQITYLQQHIERTILFSYSVYFNSEIAILLNIQNKNLDYYLHRLSMIMQLKSLSAGLSYPFEDIRELKYYYEQAKKAAITGSIIGGSIIYSYSDVMIYDLLRTLSENASLEHYMIPEIEILKKYDKKYGTDYINTLKIYLEKSGNITEISKCLFTHRNTIVHRIEKIEEICNCHLEQNEIRIKFSICFKIDKLLDGN